MTELDTGAYAMLALGRSPSSCGGGTRVSLVFVFVVTAAYVARGYPLALGPDFLSLGFAIVSAAFAVERVQEHLGYGAAVAAQRRRLGRAETARRSAAPWD